jgi:predicted ribonuclease YlaK
MYLTNKSFFPNQFVMMVSSANEKKTALTRFINEHEPFKKVRDHKAGESWGIAQKTKNKTLQWIFFMITMFLLYPLIGKAGSGKTLCALRLDWSK